MSGLEENDAEAVFRKTYTDDELNYFVSVLQQIRSPGPKEITNPEKVLYENRRYQECISYIESLEQFDSDYYITYLIKAYANTGDYSSARAIKNSYADSKVNEKDKTLKCLNEAIESTQIDKLYMAEKMLDPQLSVQNPCYTNHRGHMIANRKIDGGETILLEEPMSSIGKGKCSHCFRDSAVSKCCQSCNHIYYCSEYCKSRDITIHQWECAFYITEYATVWNKCAFRVFLKELQNDLKNNGFFVEVNDFYDSIKQHPQYKSEIMDLLIESANLTSCIMGQTELKKLILRTELFANCPENELCTIKLGGIILKLIFFCKYKAVSIFDNVLGTSVEFYPTLSNFKFSCQPNTIISRTGNKIVLKACLEIQKGEEILCGYFDMVANTTFLNILLNNDNAGMMKNCRFFCRCNKSHYNYTSIYTKSNSEDQKLIPARKIFLQLIIKNIKTYLNNKDSELLYRTFKTANEFILDKHYLLLQGIYFEVIKQEMCSDNFGNMCEYLPIIMNISYIQFFKRSHVEICSCLMHHMNIFALAKLPLHIIEVLISYLKFLEEDFYPRYSNEILLDNVKIMKSHYIVTKELNTMHEDVPMKASVA